MLLAPRPRPHLQAPPRLLLPWWLVVSVRGWDYVHERPTLDGTFPLWEEDHGLRCLGCQRVVRRGQPYMSVPQAVYANGDSLSEPRCVYCALSPITDGDSEQG